jgi:hypothetical protein
MAVDLTMSETLDGAVVADVLAGGGTGVDLGQVSSNNYVPLIDQAANTGAQDIFIRHNAVADPITSFQTYIQAFGIGTGFTYGGGDTAANDFTNLKAMGAATGVSKNNADGLSGGFWVDFNAGVSVANQFNLGSRPLEVFAYGQSNAGNDLANAIQVIKEAMVYDNAGETPAITPVDGQLGKAGDTVLGDNSHMKFRLFIPNTFVGSGIFQWETIFTYAFTS